MTYIYLISYSVNGGELLNEMITAGSMDEAVSLFKINMEMDAETGYKIHSVWVMLKEFTGGANG